jgi:enamine deaminase RidA (YjgF/YER057c/UK114 family)
MEIEERLRALGLQLPSAPSPVAAYVPAVIVGDLLYTSGSGPVGNGQPLMTGKVGSDLTIEQGYDAARQTILNLLAIVRQELGSLDRVERIVKLLGFVASAPGFGRQPEVLNGASHLLEQIFAERGKHARAAIGTNELPFNLPVEIELIVQVKS